MILAALGAALLQGFLGSLHCVGMCGPFVHALNSQPGSSFAINLSYNLGRTLSYMSVGLLLGLTGAGANAFLFSKAAALFGGLLLLYFGLAYIWPARFPGPARWHVPARLTRALGSLLNTREHRVENALLFGMASGLLPCGLLYPAYGVALSAGDPGAAALVMFVFSLGMYPALFVAGYSSRTAWARLNSGALRYAMGALMIGLGVFTIYWRLAHPHDHSQHGAAAGVSEEFPICTSSQGAAH